jgi:hypothetical protein
MLNVVVSGMAIEPPVAFNPGGWRRAAHLKTH